MTERERFLARLADQRTAGLVDIKFFFQPSKPMAPEEIFAAMNEVDGAVKSGASRRHSDWSGNDPA